MATNQSGERPFHPSNPVIGTPGQDAASFPGQQSYADTCAIRCQEFILEQFTGQDYEEDALIQDAVAHGWYAPGGGTLPENTGKLLELHGIPVTQYDGANTFNLTAELAQGHKVIVGVDSGELSGQNPVLEKISEAMGFDGADHAVVVSGIDTSNPNDVRVIVSDPGTGEAKASYPMGEFVAAWQDSNFFMAATQQPAPNWLPEMANFDYQLGHIPYVGNISYDEFVVSHDQEQWQEVAFPEQISSYSDIPAIGPGTGAVLDHTEKVLNEAQEFVDESNRDLDANPEIAAINPDMATFVAGINQTVDISQNIADGKYTEEELETISRQTQAQTAMLEGQVAAAGISNSVAATNQQISDRNYSHEQSRIASEYERDAREHADNQDYDRAQSDLDNADYHHEQAEHYDPDS